jgi:5'-nucleotidase
MRILITNDDGIDAPGLAILEDAARTLTQDVWTVAPATEQSGQSSAITLADPLRLSHLSGRRYAVSGTPADCVTIALNVVMDSKPDLVLSGVNQGFNIADDMPYSGTVGAALHAATCGIRAFAFSQAYNRLGQEKDVDIWTAAREHCAATIRTLLATPERPGVVLNVNFPPCPASQVTGLAVVRQGSRAQHEIYTDDRDDGRGKSYHWVRFRRDAGDAPADTDLGAMAARQISVTPIRADFTDTASLGPLTDALA